MFEVTYDIVKISFKDPERKFKYLYEEIESFDDARILCQFSINTKKDLSEIICIIPSRGDLDCSELEKIDELRKKYAIKNEVVE